MHAGPHSDRSKVIFETSWMFFNLTFLVNLKMSIVTTITRLILNENVQQHKLMYIINFHNYCFHTYPLTYNTQKSLCFNVIQISRTNFITNNQLSFISNDINNWKIVWGFCRYVKVVCWHIGSLSSDVVKFVSQLLLLFYFPPFYLGKW